MPLLGDGVRSDMLKAKHYNTQDEWMHVWDHYDEIKSREATERQIADTVAEIKEVCKGRNAAYAWSGGKDSVALQIVCEDAGIKQGFCCYNDLYFSESIQFFRENLPEGVELYNSGEDISWLAKHPKFLFPKTPHMWNIQTHLKYQSVYCKKNGVDILMMGKRTQDGNFVSKDLIMSNRKGVNIYCPIRNWTHEDVICAIRYRGKSLSPVYFTENGFHYGDTKFAVMNPLKGERIEDAWKRIYAIEPEKVVLSAKAGLAGAYSALEEIFNDRY